MLQNFGCKVSPQYVPVLSFELAVLSSCPTQNWKGCRCATVLILKTDDLGAVQKSIYNNYYDSPMCVTNTSKAFAKDV
jgi:hypothetical protein